MNHPHMLASQASQIKEPPVYYQRLLVHLLRGREPGVSSHHRFPSRRSSHFVNCVAHITYPIPMMDNTTLTSSILLHLIFADYSALSASSAPSASESSALAFFSTLGRAPLAMRSSLMPLMVRTAPSISRGFLI